VIFNNNNDDRDRNRDRNSNSNNSNTSPLSPPNNKGKAPIKRRAYKKKDIGSIASIGSNTIGTSNSAATSGASPSRTSSN
jgi:hypothetical protein